MYLNNSYEEAYVLDKEWKKVNVKGYEDLYNVSNYGEIYSVFSNKVLSPSYNKHTGYLEITLYNNGDTFRTSVHRLVALTFVRNPHKYNVVNHKDEDKTNNRADNLEWCTSKYNLNYGTLKERISESRLENDTAKKVPIIVYKNKEFYKEYKSLRRASDDLGLNRGRISSRLQSPDIYTDFIGEYTFKYKDSNRPVNSKTYDVDPATHGINNHSRTQTREEVQERISKVRPNLVLGEDYVKTKAKCHVFCKKHKVYRMMTAHGILTQGDNCRQCAVESYRAIKSHSREYYQGKLDEHQLNTLTIGEDYTVGSEKCTFTCSNCGKSFTKTPVGLLSKYVGNGCKHCNKSHTMTIRNLKKYSHSDEEIKEALIKKNLNW